MNVNSENQEILLKLSEENRTLKEEIELLEIENGKFNVEPAVESSYVSLFEENQSTNELQLWEVYFEEFVSQLERSISNQRECLL